MRNIAIVLLLFNVGFFGWALIVPDPMPSRLNSVSIEIAGNRLTLLSEVSSRISNLENSLVKETKDGLICWIIGGFNDQVEANELLQYLESEGIQSSRLLASFERDGLYHVYLPSFSSREVASITLDTISENLGLLGSRLQGQVSTQEPLLNGISFGYYEKVDDAMVVNGELEKIGFKGVIDKVPDFNEDLRVVAEIEKNSQFESRIWPRLIVERPTLHRTENLCETIAQGEQFP